MIRVSRVGDREGESFVSPTDQRDRIEMACARDGLDLQAVHEELNVSGGAALERRTGLRQAVQSIEAGEADVVVVAYFDRLVRSLQVQREVVERVEKAGGAIVAVDVGEVRADTASRWLSSTLLGMVAEYARRVTGERTADAKKRAVARGVPPFPNVPPGYRRRDDASIEPDPDQAPAVAEAFGLRAGGATVAAVREHLRQHGIERSFHGVQAMLGSRVYLGELHFGELVNLDSHLAIVKPDVWQRVQRMSVSRGRRAKSDRLLARLGVLRCGTCGGRMAIGTTRQQGKSYTFYRCSPTSDCPQRVTVSADLAESVIVDEVRRLLDGINEGATVADGIGDAERNLEACEQELDAAVRAFQGLEDVDTARARLLGLRDARERARDRLVELQAAAAPAMTISASGDWDLLTLDAQRALIRAVIGRATVAPGRGRDRISVEPLGQ